jgi:isochorismate synthase
MLFRITRIDSLIERAASRARSTGRAVLVSVSERIDIADPLDALDALTERIAADEVLRPLLDGGRMYWERPRESFILAGVGAALILGTPGADRFSAAGREWDTLLESAVTDDAGAADRPGPVLMGGFSFDPVGPQTEMWTGFTSAHLIVPRFLVASIEGKSSATINFFVTESGAPDVDVARLTGSLDDLRRTPVRSGFESQLISSTPVISNLTSRGEWQETVRSAIAEIDAGNLEKVVLARAVQMIAPDSIDVYELLRNLRAVHAESFVFAVWNADRAFVGASPERLVRLDGREVEASSLAGTIERGSDPAEDAANAEMLRQSAKDLAEHAAVRDELMQALSATCDDVTVADEPSLLTLPNVHHLHTSLKARLREGDSLLNLMARLHPTPAVGGSPRKPALEFIEEHEDLDRGWYAAPVGWIGRQRGEFAVALRSALIEGSEAILFAGCGIVAGSDPDLEYAESNLKLQAMQSAIVASISGEGDDLEMTTASEHST